MIIMILKSFFRNKITKVYSLIFIILFTVLLIIMSFLGYFEKIQNDLFSKRSILIIASEKDSYDVLKENQLISNIQKKVILSPDKTYNVIVDQEYVLKNSNGDTIDEHIINDKNYEYKIKWNDLIINDFNYILVSPDTTNQLEKQEIAIGLNPTWYNYYKDYFSFSLNQKIGFKTEEENLEFNISNFYENLWPEILVSEDEYNELLSKQKLFVYTMNINSYSESDHIKSELEKQFNGKNDKVILESSYLNLESTQVSNIGDLIDVLKLVSYIIIFLFFIIVFIVINNILLDFRKKSLIERKLGFSIKQIKKNNIIRLLSLYLISFIISIILSLIIIIIIKYIFHIQLIIVNLKLLLIIFLCGLIINILSVLFRRNT